MVVHGIWIHLMSINHKHAQQKFALDSAKRTGSPNCYTTQCWQILQSCHIIRSLHLIAKVPIHTQPHTKQMCMCVHDILFMHMYISMCPINKKKIHDHHKFMIANKKQLSCICISTHCVPWINGDMLSQLTSVILCLSSTLLWESFGFYIILLKVWATFTQDTLVPLLLYIYLANISLFFTFSMSEQVNQITIFSSLYPDPK